jgi:Spy/CpxP family protein refolding chaperone
MSTFRSLIFAAGFMAIGAFTTIGLEAVARPGHGSPGPEVARLLGALDLSDSQQELAAEIRHAAREHRESVRAERESMRAERMALLGSASVDREAVHAELDARASERLDFAHTMADMALDLHATLDDEQRARLVERMSERDGQRDPSPPRRGTQRGDL